MASSYPGSLDAFTTIASDKKTSDSVGGRTHRDMHNDLGDAIEAVQAELGTDPAGAYATVKARLDAHPFIGSGTGSPEGAVTGSPGQQWLQTDGVDTKGWILWRKATGTATNTGWIPGPEADTGWRNLAGETLSNGWGVYSSTFALRRIGHQVTVVGWFDGGVATNDAAYTLPAGFRPVSYSATALVQVGFTAGTRLMEITTGGVMTIYSRAADVHFFSATFPTSATWPTTLP